MQKATARRDAAERTMMRPKAKLITEGVADDGRLSHAKSLALYPLLTAHTHLDNVTRYPRRIAPEAEMNSQTDMTLVMVDDNQDEIFLTRRLVRRDGIVNDFISEKKPERLFETLDNLRSTGVDPQQMIVLLD